MDWIIDSTNQQSGELVKVMRGEELSSTDLHLANGDTLLVGQVAELEPVDLNETSSSNKVHHRRLQVIKAMIMMIMS